MSEKRLISSKGQVVVPKKIRDYMDLKEGDELQFIIRETGEVVISPIKGNNPASLFGTLPPINANTDNFETVLATAKKERLTKRMSDRKL